MKVQVKKRSTIIKSPIFELHKHNMFQKKAEIIYSRSEVKYFTCFKIEKAHNIFALFFRNSNGACDHQLNSPECMYDGGDCCVPLIFDRFCSYPLCQCRADRTQRSFCKYFI